MKNFMFAVVALVLVLGLSQTASAQGYASAGATLAFTVENTLTIVGGEVVWEGLTQGQCYTITADGFITPPTSAGATVDANAQAAFTIEDANPGDLLEMSFILPSFALGVDGIGRIQLSDWTYAYDVDADVSNGYNQAGPISGPVTVVAAIGAAVFVGFQACVDVGAQAGDYAAQLVLEAHYLMGQTP